MPPSFETDQTRNNALFLIASVSPRAKESLEKELYRASADSDQAGEEFILEHCLVEMIKDLEEIGLVINLDPTVFISDMDDLFKLIHLAQMLLPNHLYPLMLSDPMYRSIVTDVVLGNHDGDMTAIESYLTLLGGDEEQIPYAPALESFIGSLRSSIGQTAVFSDYLRQQVQLIDEEQLMPASDQEMHLKYNEKIKTIIDRLGEALHIFMEHPRIDLAVRLFIHDLTAPVNFHDYAYLFLESKRSLPDDLISGYERKWMHYWVSHRWNAMYYKLRKLPADVDLIPLYYAVPYALLEDESDYRKIVDHFDPAWRHVESEEGILNMYRSEPA